MRIRQVAHVAPDRIEACAANGAIRICPDQACVWPCSWANNLCDGNRAHVLPLPRLLAYAHAAQPAQTPAQQVYALHHGAQYLLLR